MGRCRDELITLSDGTWSGCRPTGPDLTGRPGRGNRWCVPESERAGLGVVSSSPVRRSRSSGWPPGRPVPSPARRRVRAPGTRVRKARGQGADLLRACSSRAPGHAAARRRAPAAGRVNVPPSRLMRVPHRGAVGGAQCGTARPTARCPHPAPAATPRPRSPAEPCAPASRRAARGAGHRPTPPRRPAPRCRERLPVHDPGPADLLGELLGDERQHRVQGQQQRGQRVGHASRAPASPSYRSSLRASR